MSNDRKSASEHAAINYGGSTSDSSLSASELRRRHGVRDNKRQWANTAAPGVSTGDGDGGVVMVAIVAVVFVIAIVAYFMR